MPELSRRKFLTTGSLAVALGGAAVAVPSLHSVLESSPSETNGNTTPLSAAEAHKAGNVPVVAVSDPGSGAITLYHGEHQVVYNDPKLAAKLYRTISKEER